MEDYKKLYEQTQRRMKEFIKRWDGIKLSSNDLFTEELKQIVEIENEDERVRKEIIETFKILGDGKIPVDINYADIFAWLEKQGEQKPSDEDMKEALRTEYEKNRADAFAQMQQGWSDKEKQMYADIIEATKKSGVFKEAYKRELVDFLNFLKERHTWKPSEKQMNAFEQVYDWYNNNFAPSETLTSLYNDLKKLREE